MSTYSFRSCADPDEGSEPGGSVGNWDSSGLGRASSLSELLEGLRKWHGRADGSTTSLPDYWGLNPLLGPRGPSSGASQHPQTSFPTAAPSRQSRQNKRTPGFISSLQGLEPNSTAPPTLPPRRTKPMRRRLLDRVVSEGGGEGYLGSEPMVFQNHRLLGDSNCHNAASDSHLTGPVHQQPGQFSRRALSVHLQELPPSTHSRKGSDSSSTSSGSGRRGAGRD